MRAAVVMALSPVMALSGQTTSAAAESTCNAPTNASWLTPSDPTVDWNARKYVSIPPSSVHKVVVDNTLAVRMLAANFAAPISTEQASRFTGIAAAKLPSATRQLKPYLIRSVFAGSNPSISASWYGDFLEISTATLGCLPYRNTPLVVFLTQPPRRLYVTANSAL